MVDLGRKDNLGVNGAHGQMEAADATEEVGDTQWGRVRVLGAFG